MLKDYKGNLVSSERFAEVEAAWKEYWNEYCENFPEADGSDYVDVRECFMMNELGGEFKRF